MKLRRNLRALFAEFNAASAADKPNTALMKLKAAILELRNVATHPSQLIGRADVVSDIANDISMGMLATGSTLKSRYDDFVWAHHQVMMLGPNDPSGPNLAHRGPAFGPWHRELLKLFEEELRAAIGDPDLCLPYWDWTKDQSAADPGFPFTTEFLGGNGGGPPNDTVSTGDFAGAINCDEEGWFVLRRRFGGDGPGLPTVQSVRDSLNVTPYDSAGWNWSSSATTSFRNVLEGWVGPRAIHNAVHRWVDGSMQPGTSPNDPVFFLHHCNIDRLWSVWEQKNSGQSPYLPDSSTAAANGLTRLNELMSTFGRSATDRYFGVDVSPADVVNSKAITWYDSDLPELQNETGATLSFVNIPQGLTSYKAVKFKVTGGRPVHFRITGLPASPFGQTTMGPEFTATPDPNADFYYGYVWVQLVAPAGAVAPSAVDIHAYIVDEEGYYASTIGGEYPLGDFHVSLTATTVARENNSVCLVLDRSGSMSDPAGGTSTKNSLLKTAVGVFNSLMLPNDEIALVSFDDQIATPAPMAAVSAGTVPPVLMSHDLDPRGLTCIGGGIQQGATELGSATHTNRSMLVLTDGVQNVHPFVGELPAGTITDRTYAIGFGLPQDINVQVLNDVTANTHGDLIITGDISTEEQTFNLTKYFVQVLAGVSRMDVLLDPQGVLMAGSRHEIPFHVTAADIYADVIALTPLPQILEFTLITPSGDVIDPATGGGNVSYQVKPGVAFYRIGLPTLPANPGGSHAGTWRAVLALKDRKDIDKLLNDRAFATHAAGAFASGGLRYSLVAHAYSNLRFDARLRQDAYRPGAAVTLEASLLAYDVAFTGQAAVWADVTAPDGATSTVKLAPLGGGRYAGAFTAGLPGVYPCRVRAEGYFQSKDKFTREKTLTAVVFNGDRGEGGAGDDDPLCRLRHCLTEDKVLSPTFYRRLKELGFDAKLFLECLETHCPPIAEHVPPKRKPVRRPTGDPTKALKGEPKTRAAPRPVVRPMPKSYPVFQYPRIIHMFAKDDTDMGSMGGGAPDGGGKGGGQSGGGASGGGPGGGQTGGGQTGGGMPGMPGMGGGGKPKAAGRKVAPKAFPRAVRRFSKPEEGGTD